MSDWRDGVTAPRGRLVRDAELAPYTWFRVGGPADLLFLPADEADLADFLERLDPAVPVTVLGVGSNVLVRDGGLDGVVIRLGRAFAEIADAGPSRLRVGAATLDAALARHAGEAGIAGLEFYRGVPGAVGGALVMNAGCYGRETRDVLVEAFALSRRGQRLTLSNAEMGFEYRRSRRAEAEPLIFTGAVFEGRPEAPAAVLARMDEITARRETTQPIREKTGGSTFKNPPGDSAWRLIDAAGWRGRPLGGAKFSELHANFMINFAEASAADLEKLGETVRADVLAQSGVELAWEIKRLGRPSAN